MKKKFEKNRKLLMIMGVMLGLSIMLGTGASAYAIGHAQGVKMRQQAPDKIAERFLRITPEERHEFSAIGRVLEKENIGDGKTRLTLGLRDGAKKKVLLSPETRLQGLMSLEEIDVSDLVIAIGEPDGPVLQAKVLKLARHR